MQAPFDKSVRLATLGNPSVALRAPARSGMDCMPAIADGLDPPMPPIPGEDRPSWPILTSQNASHSAALISPSMARLCMREAAAVEGGMGLQSSRRGAHAPRPLTPPYVRFRIRRFVSIIRTKVSCPAKRQVRRKRSISWGRPCSCARHPRSTTIRDRFRPNVSRSPHQALAL